MRSRASRHGLAAVAAGALVVLAACDPADTPATSGGTSQDGIPGRGGSPSSPSQSPAPLVASLAEPEEVSVVDGDDAGERALAVSRALFASAPVVVVAAPDEQLRAASAAAALGVPVVVDGQESQEEVQRLGAEVALAIGAVQDPGIDVVVPEDDEALAQLLGVDGPPVPVDADDVTDAVAELDPAAPQLLVPAASEDGEGDGSDDGDGEGDGSDDEAATTQAPQDAPLSGDRNDLPQTAPPEARTATVVLTTGSEEDVAALGSARAAGASVVHAAGGDPRGTSESVQAVAEAAPTAVVGLGEEFGDAETLGWRTRTAATGQELPGGGQLVLPDKTYVALYGTPSTSALGVLGEQPIEETVTRAQELAAAYEPLTDEPVIPTLEIIASIASEGPGPDGDYSNELPVEEIRPLVELAGEHGLYVVLDLQPGRTDFLTQAQMYEELLLLPHVGLALDPEWRLRPDEVHLRQIGQVEVSEVDEVVTYLADLTREHELPQKVLVLHQFQIRMIPGVNEVDQSRSELAVLIHADGQGAQGAKQGTWQALHDNAPDVDHWGWKNFYDEDLPGPLTPEETMSLVEPTPDFISYQ